MIALTKKKLKEYLNYQIYGNKFDNMNIVTDYITIPAICNINITRARTNNVCIKSPPKPPIKPRAHKMTIRIIN